MVVADLVNAAGAVCAQRRRCAGDAGIVSKELAREAALVGRLDQQRQVRTPVAGDHGVSAGCLDFGDVGRKVAGLGQRVQVFTHDLDIRPLARQGFFGVLGHLHAVRVVLPQDVDLLDVFLLGDEARHGFHFHGGVGVKAEVPVAALAVGQVRVYSRVVQKDHFLAGVALVVLADRIGQRQRHRRAVALDDVAHTLVDGGFQGVQALGRAELVVHTGDFKLDACGVARTAEFVGKELVALELAHADRAEQAGLCINAHHLDHLTGQGACGRSGLGSSRFGWCLGLGQAGQQQA